ncbi:MAG: site-specific tyrosine recombinase XerD [Micrococcales bacterium]|nr:site-specific tyrosine recombinase XerD [Micrococcales bacterium]
MPGAADLRAQLERDLRHLAIERGLAANTIAAYRRDLAALLDALGPDGPVPPELLTAAGVRHAILREGVAATSRARRVSSARGFARFLVEEGVLEADPLSEVIAPKLPQRLPKAMTIDQVQRLLDAADGDEPLRLRDRALLELLYATGARVSEAVALGVDDLVGEAGTADAVRLLGKGGKQRIVPVGSYARAAIDGYLVRARPLLSARGRATPALFLGARGGRLSRQGAWLVIRAAAARAKLGFEPSPHSLRHSFATHLLQGGADVRVVQELLGHANVATTQIYTMVTADSLRDAYLSAHPRAR